MTDDTSRHELFPTAGEDAREAEQQVDTPQSLSPSYRLAYRDTDFLLRDELRPVRLQLELLKPELILNEQAIETTIVVFGSARIAAPEVAAARLEAARDDLARAPEDPEARRRVHLAERANERSRYYAEAREFARLVSERCQTPERRDFVVVTGGGPGIMEAANRGAHDAGAVSIGLNIVLPMEEVPNVYTTPELCFQFHYFALRKMHFLMRARALVLFPGGFGTLDELFDALTLIQTGKIKPMPVLLFGRSYWRRIIDFEAMADEGVISEADVDLIQFVETAEEAWQRIRDHYGITDTPCA